MILLWIATVLTAISGFVWASIQTTVLGYQTLHAGHNITQQFVLAEFTLSAAENWLLNSTKVPVENPHCHRAPCVFPAYSADYFPGKSTRWWKSGSVFVNPIYMSIPEPHSAFYVVEHLTEASTITESYYRVTAWALLDGQHRATILQGVYLKSLDSFKNRRLSWRAW